MKKVSRPTAPQPKRPRPTSPRPRETGGSREPCPRGLRWLGWGSLGLTVLVCFGVWPLSGGDLLMHLTVGRWTWEHGGPPLTDPFSYVTEGQEFIAHSWLAELAFYLLERASGTVGFMALRFALISVALVCAWRTAKALEATTSAMILVSPLVLWVMWGRLEFRPQLLTTAFLSVELYLLVSVHRGQRSARWLWALVPMHLIWVNWHGGFIQGLLMLAVVSIAQAVMAWRDGRRQPLRSLPLVLLACVAASCVTPYGPRLLYFPFEMQAVARQTSERLSQASRGLVQTFEWFSPVVQEGWTMVGGGIFVPIRPVFFAYAALLAITLLAAVRRWKRADLVTTAVMALWLAMSLRMLRQTADATLLTSPFVATWLSGYAHQKRRVPLLTGIVGLLGLTALATWWAVAFSREYDWRWTRGQPPCVTAAIGRLGLSGRAFAEANNFWLLYQLHPAVRVETT